jgi:hypothetical protein
MSFSAGRAIRGGKSMFGSNGRKPFTCRGVGCVKLPATAAFPTDDKLLQRIEEARRALPRNSMKALRRVPQTGDPKWVSELLTPSAGAEEALRADAAHAAIQRFRAAGTDLELYPRSRAAAG